MERNDLFQGDIILTDKQKDALRAAELFQNGTLKHPELSRNGLRDESYLWPNNTLPYLLYSSFSKYIYEFLLFA